MNSLFKKIAVRISLFFLVVIIAVSIGSIAYLDRFYKDDVKQGLLLQAQIIESVIEDGSDVSSFTHSINEIRDMRVTIIGTDGVVFLDTDADPAAMDNHLMRPEIQQALKEGSGVNIRRSDTLNRELMYAAIYSESEQLFIRVALPLEGVSVYASGFWLPLVIVILISFLLCLAISLLVSRRVVKPIIYLNKETEKIAEGRYDDIKPVKTGDEVEALSEALSGMATALQRNIADITEKNTRLQAVFKAVPGGIIAVDKARAVIMVNPAAKEMFSITGNPEGKDFLEIVKHPKLESVIEEALYSNSVVEKEIVLQKGMDKIYLQVFAVSVVGDSTGYGVILLAQDITRIRKLENMRSDFAANVSHELKTPLTVISGFIDTLKDPSISKQDAGRFLEIISLESERLTRLIDDILILSDIENAALPTSSSNLREGVQEAIELLENNAKEKGVKVSLSICDDEIIVASEKDRIKQMIINLVDNAIKYTPSGGNVDIIVKKDLNRAFLSVRDTGIGIPEENLPRLFERFYRVDKSRSRALGGTGLGLAIVKHIVNLLGGHITVQSKVGMGSNFDVYLPILDNNDESL